MSSFLVPHSDISSRNNFLYLILHHKPPLNHLILSVYICESICSQHPENLSHLHPPPLPRIMASGFLTEFLFPSQTSQRYRRYTKWSTFICHEDYFAFIVILICILGLFHLYRFSFILLSFSIIRGPEDLKIYLLLSALVILWKSVTLKILFILFIYLSVTSEALFIYSF